MPPVIADALNDHDKSIDAASVAQYKSRDPQTGRIWGAPSAFGGGQCLDCPNKATLPSTRCISCQLKLVEATCTPMPPDTLQQVQNAFDALLKGWSGKRHEDTTKNFQLLYSKLKRGVIPQQVQAQLLQIAESISKNNYVEARRICTTVQHNIGSIIRIGLLV